MINKNGFFLSIVFLFILLTLFLGCVEQTPTVESTDSFEISEVTVTTEAYSYATGWKVFKLDTLPHPESLPEIAPPAAVYLPEEFSKARYSISFTITNIGSSMEPSVHATVTFYGNDTVLFSKNFNRLSSIQPGESHEFNWYYTDDDEHYQEFFYKISDMEILPGLRGIDFDDSTKP
ncbi:MAG: hypothetical protein QCI00_06825 [Candidatus Thermoplasmatota archaeon]|nr:hypothetical protein [Candidatus Thermoplasmatota archaeon]